MGWRNLGGHKWGSLKWPSGGLKRAVRFAVLQEVGSGGKSAGLIAAVAHNPEIITLGNDGMMLAGFEKIDERRLYQGW